MIVNRQRAVRVSLQELEKFLRRARRALHLPIGAVTVCLVTDADMARWNRSYRGKNRATDVLSFPNSAESSGERNRVRSRSRKRRGEVKLKARNSVSHYLMPCLGDIAIAPSVARRNARRLGRSLHDEIRILMLHGMLHLMGYDHETDDGQMDRRERRLRRLLGVA